MAIDDVRLQRIRWRCRRGMLENDLILARFLDARGDSLNDEDVASLDRLLDLSDPALWELLGGKADVPDRALAALVARLRTM